MMKKAAPSLKRHFHRGTPAGHAGMRMKMIGYGRFRYVMSGEAVDWPVIGLALQKNYISAYVSVTRGKSPIVPLYARRLAALRSGGNNFSFEKFDDLNAEAATALFAEVAAIFKADPVNPVRYMQGES